MYTFSIKFDIRRWNHWLHELTVDVRRLLTSNARSVSELIVNWLKKRVYHSSREINDTYYNSGIEENNFYYSIIIAKLW